MKANELMIGDLYCVTKDVCFKKGTIVVIRGIDADRTFHELKGCATCIALGDSYNMQGSVWLDYLAQIPLTSEILEKNGFVNDRGIYCWRDENKQITYFSKENNRPYCTYSFVNIESGCIVVNELPIEYVHELQHTLRLCGIKIEIEL